MQGVSEGARFKVQLNTTYKKEDKINKRQGARYKKRAWGKGSKPWKARYRQEGQAVKYGL